MVSIGMVSSQRSLESGDTVFAYCRDSGGKEQERSVDDQIAEIREYADALGVIVVKVYADRGITGTTDDRPQFQHMIADCRQSPPPVQGIIVWHLNRIGRNELDRQFYISDLRRRGLVVRSVSQKMLDGPLAGPMEAMLAWHDEQFIRDLRIDVKRGLERVGEHRNHGMRVPAGYRRTIVQIGTHRDGTPRNVQRWQPDPEKVSRVVLAFRMYAAGNSFREIHRATDLFEAVSSYGKMFRNPLYIGVVRVGDYRRVDDSLRIVSDELWEAAQKRNNAPPLGRSQHSQYLLSGLARCGICGSAMVGQTNRSVRERMEKPNRKTNRYYRCSAFSSKLAEVKCQNMIRCEVLEAQVLDKVLAHLSDDAIEEFVRELESRWTSAKVGAEISRTDADIAAAKKTVTNLVALAGLGGIAGDEVRRQLQEQETLISELSRKRSGLMVAKRRAPDPAKVRATLHKMRDDLHSDDISLARSVLRALITRILVTPTQNEIVYRADLEILN